MSRWLRKNPRQPLTASHTLAIRASSALIQAGRNQTTHGGAVAGRIGCGLRQRLTITSATVVIEEPTIRIACTLRTARASSRRTSDLDASSAHGSAHAAAGVATVLPGATDLGATADTTGGTACSHSSAAT